MKPHDGVSSLRVEQTVLVQALLGKAAPPPGIPLDRMMAAIRGLSRKRARSVARAWPSLAGALGEAFALRFAEYAAAVPLPSQGGPLADGRAFAAFLGRDPLPSDACREALWVDLHYFHCKEGLRPRRGLAFRVFRDAYSSVWLVGIRVPWLGARILALRLLFSRVCRIGAATKKDPSPRRQQGA